MRRMFAMICCASFLLTAVTLGGMALFGMQTMMDAPSAHSMHAHGMDCVHECVVSVSPATVVPMPLIVSAFAVACYFFLLFWRSVANAALPVRGKWREGIGKLLLKRQLAPVLLRD